MHALQRSYPSLLGILKHDSQDRDIWTCNTGPFLLLPTVGRLHERMMASTISDHGRIARGSESLHTAGAAFVSYPVLLSCPVAAALTTTTPVLSDNFQHNQLVVELSGALLTQQAASLPLDLV